MDAADAKSVPRPRKAFRPARKLALGEPLSALLSWVPFRDGAIIARLDLSCEPLQKGENTVSSREVALHNFRIMRRSKFVTLSATAARLNLEKRPCCKCPMTSGLLHFL